MIIHIINKWLNVNEYNCIICDHRIYQKAFLNWLCQYLSFLNIFWIDFARWKSVSYPTLHISFESFERHQKKLNRLRYLSKAAFSSTYFLQSFNTCFKNHFRWKGNSSIKNLNKKEKERKGETKKQAWSSKP